MGQNPFQNFIANPGGTLSKLNMTGVGQIKNSPGKLRKLLVVVAGATSPLVLTDMAQGGTPAAANEVHAIPVAQLTAGAIITLDWPFLAGIAVTGTWPVGLVLSASYD